MNLFSPLAIEPTYEELFPGAVLMRGLALPQDAEFFAAMQKVLALAPLHNTATPGGLPMGVMVSDCGTPEAFRRRWDPLNPQIRKLWPPIPRVLMDFSLRCAVRAGFPLFRPDSCHFNRYHAGIKLGIHQDRHECDLTQPIVSISLGLECIFLPGGHAADRQDQADPAGTRRRDRMGRPFAHAVPRRAAIEAGTSPDDRSVPL